MVDTTEEIRKMEIMDNIYSLAQQIFQLIQHQEIEITINQQTIRYKNMAKIPQHKVQKRLENVVDKIMTKIKVAIKEQQIRKLDLVNAKIFEKLLPFPLGTTRKYTEFDTYRRYGLLTRELLATKPRKKLTDLRIWEATDKTTIEALSIIQKTSSKPSDTTLSEHH
ncbi:hypothetical protein G9A89_019508 [Geosiphon pyriformis]|nr:hypothetical protein G9A89_019508 [Geosiphon pyriformis]